MTKISVKQLAVFKGHKSSIYTLEKGDGNNFYSSGGDGMMVEWDSSTPEKGHLCATVPNQIFSMLRIPEQQILLLGQLHGGIHLLDLNSKKEVKLLQAHGSAVFQIFRLKDEENYFYSIGGDGVILKWNLAQMAVENQARISTESLRFALYLDKRKQLALASSDKSIYFIDPKTLEIQQQFEAHEHSVFSLATSQDEKYLISGGRDAQIRVWNLNENCDFCLSIPAHLFTVNDLATSPNGKWLASASRDKDVKIWDANSFELLKVLDKEKFQGHKNSVNRLCWMDNTTFVSAGDDRTIILWQINEDE